jgi:antirestriction protein ArdC
MAATTSQPVGNPNVDKPLRDLRQEVTDSIVEMLERGVAPWQKPWEPGRGSLEMPFNPTSERAYRGGNALHLMATGLQRGYQDPRWMTYKQAIEAGWQVRRGEKGTQIEYWEVKPASDKSTSDRSRDGGAADFAKPQLIHRVYTVFNAEQIDRVPLHLPKEYTPFEAIQAGEQILRNSGANIAHDQADRAFYSRSEDSIHLPPRDAFKDAGGYYGTALHELAHWSGHPSRLDRATLTEAYRFGDVNYAREELRAELASVFLAAQRGIPHDPEQHAAYVGSWIAALKRDKNEIFRAAHDASEATDFILALERDKTLAEERLIAGSELGATASGNSAVAVLEQETEDVERDRERVAEKESDAGLDSTASTPVTDGPHERSGPTRESSNYAARFEPGSSTVNVEAKQTGTDRRSTVDASALTEAQSIATKVLGNSAKTLAAETQSGSYRGTVIGETVHYLIQRQSARTAIAHPKDLLDRTPGLGETVRINYSNSQAFVREAPQRGKGQHLGR